MNSKCVPQEFDARDAVLRRGRRCAPLMPPPLSKEGHS